MVDSVMSSLRVGFLRRKIPRLGIYIALATAAVFIIFPQTAPSQLSPYLPSISRASRKPEVLTYYSDGIAGNWTEGISPHPIEELISRGKDKWETMLKR